MMRAGGGAPSIASIATALSGEDTITAFAGGGQGSATALSATVTNHRVTTVATAADSVKLPAATVGLEHYVRNDGAAAMQVFGQATETIDGIASATGVSQPAGTGVLYVCTTAAKWTSSPRINPVVAGGTGAITAQAAAKSLGVPWILSKSGIPLIAISSGSIAAGGGISGITALSRIFPRAYCYFPANALATSIAAGWYYCTFSSTTAGTAFLDTWAGTGVPTVPGSPTAVTDGRGAYTGVTTAVTGFSVSLPANSLAANGTLVYEITTSATNSAGTKAQTPRFGGTNVTSFNLTTQLSLEHRYVVTNSGNTGNQTSSGLATSGGTVASGGASTTNFAIDTTSAQTIDFLMTRNTATDNHVIERWALIVYADGN